MSDDKTVCGRCNGGRIIDTRSKVPMQRWQPCPRCGESNPAARIPNCFELKDGIDPAELVDLMHRRNHRN